jgi:Protein of unknown function (DUF4031)
MAVYVDDMRAQYGRLVMCHMLADDDESLHAMADAIGVKRRWWQAPPKHSSHYDICLSKRALAIQHGAIPITMREAAYMNRARRLTGVMANLAEARAYFAAREIEFAARRAAAVPQGSLFSE